MKKTVDILSRFVEDLKLGINPPSKVNKSVSTSDMYDTYPGCTSCPPAKIIVRVIVYDFAHASPVSTHLD